MADIKMLGERIYQRRKELGLTLQEIADKIGVTKSTIQRYETGKISTPKLPVIESIARAIEANPLWLIGKSDKKEASRSTSAWIATEKRPLLKFSPKGVFESEEKHQKFNENGESDADFCIKMSGDSMISSRIYDGDIVFIKRQDDVSDGDLTAVELNGEISLKRIFKLGDRVQLRCENPAYPPITLEGEELDTLKILGKAVAFQSKIGV